MIKIGVWPFPYEMRHAFYFCGPGEDKLYTYVSSLLNLKNYLTNYFY